MLERALGGGHGFTGSPDLGVGLPFGVLALGADDVDERLAFAGLAAALAGVEDGDCEEHRGAPGTRGDEETGGRQHRGAEERGD